MAPTSTSVTEQQPFTFTSPVSSETHEDALDFDYESWIEQSKIANHCSDLWPDDAEAQAISRHHREMMLRAADSLPEEAYELSLRDLSELSLPSRATTTDEPASSGSFRWSTARGPSNTKPWRKKTPSMEGASFIIKLFMPSPSRAAAAGGRRRRKSFSNSTASALRENNASVNDSSRVNAASRTIMDLSSTRSHSMPRKNQDTTNRYLQILGISRFKNARFRL